MWIGIVIGLLLGIGTGSLPTALIFGAVGGVVGALTARAAKKDGDEAAEPETRRDLEALKEQLQQSNRRIDQLERRLQEMAGAPATADVPQAAPPPQTIIETPAADVSPREEDAGLPPVQEIAAETPPLTPAIKPEPPIIPATTQPERIVRPAVYSAPQTPAPPPAAPAAAASAASLPPRSASTGEQPAPRFPEEELPVLPEWLTGFVQRWIIGGNPIVTIGVLVLFLGLAFLLRYVAEHTTVPIEYRYAGVAAAGIGLLLGGWRWRGRPDNYGLILQGAGIGVLYLTTLAGMKIHPLIPPQAGFALLAGVALFAVVLAVLQDALSLAAVASLGGFAAPVLASTGSENHLAFFSYLTLLNLVIAATAWFKAWRVLNLIGFVSTAFLANGWGQKYYQPALFNIAEPFLLLLFVLYVLIAFLFARRTLADAPETAGASFADHVRQTVPQVNYVDGTLVFGVPMAAFGMQYMIVRSFENGPAYSALGFGLTYIFLAYALFRGTGMRYALLSETMVALAVVFGSLAIPLGLEGKWTSAAWAVEAAGVYWVGIRQHRVHARLFALLLLAGSAIYFVLDLQPGDAVTSVISGSWLGCVMLAVSLWSVYGLVVRAGPEDLYSGERQLRPLLAAAGCLVVALLPFLLMKLDWASTALAVLGAVAVFAARPLAERSLIAWGSFYQLAAGALYYSTLRYAGSGAAMKGGWPMLAAAVLIAAAMLASAWTSRNEEKAGGGPAPLAGLSILVLLGGLAFANLAPLFVMEWRYAAMLWAGASVGIIWWGMRVSVVEAVLFALGLQLLTGSVAFSRDLLSFSSLDGAAPAIRPFLHSAFWLPLIIAVSAFVAARLMHRRSEASSNAAGWGLLAWSTGWWVFAWEAEFERLLTYEQTVMALLALAMVTAALWWALARYAKWRLTGQAALIYLPVLVVLLALEMALVAGHPFDGWGAILWPLALAMHIVLLWGQKDWLELWAQKPVHTAGAWFFVTLAALELHWQFMRWGGVESAWPMLGSLLAPLGYLWAVSSDTVRSRWPLREFRDSYALIAAFPVVAFLLGWVAQSAVMGNGSAPLPYMPVLNPLEIGQIAVLLAIALWWRSLHEHPAFQGRSGLLGTIIGVAAFGVVSSMVLRTCHQWNGIPWEKHALLSSMLVQTSLSIVWGTIAIAMMLIGHFRGLRPVWIIGAGLVAVVVGKLFLVELAATGSLERIVSFIVVGSLLLVVGYFAPLPPKQEAHADGQAEKTA